jgi:ABC-type branched-subunit amino acid transport system substrate-binding protein
VRRRLRLALEASAAYMNQTGGIDGHLSALLLAACGSSSSSSGGSGGSSGSTSAHSPFTIFAVVDLSGRTQAYGQQDKTAEKVCPRMFVVSQPEALTAEASAAYFKAQGYKKVGILEEEDAFSQHENGYTVEYLKQDGITPVVATFPSTAVNVTPELQEVEEQHIDALYSEALGPPAGFVARARQSLGLVGSLPLVFDGGGASADLTKLAPRSALVNSKELIQLPQDPTLKQPGRSLMLKYGAKYGGFDQPLDIGGFPWDDMIAIRAAAQQAGSIQLNKMVPALTNLSAKAQNSPLYMLTKSVKFTAGDHENGDATVQDFKVVPVGPLVNGMVQPSSS